MRNFVKKFALNLGFRITKLKSYDNLLAQRARAIDLLACSGPRERAGVSCVIFSKDRAIQLYALFESMRKYVAGLSSVSVLYSFSSQNHELAYDDVISEVSVSDDGKFILEGGGNFQDDLASLLRAITTKNLIFLVDDDLFISKIDFSELADVSFIDQVFSCRLGKNITESYTAGGKFLPPTLVPSKTIMDGLDFFWGESECEWADPYSLDGHVFDSAKIQAISSVSKFSGPNSYEAELKSFSDNLIGKKGICRPQPCLINIANNVVQSEYKNRHGGVSSEYLLSQWLRGLKIDIDRLSLTGRFATHVEEPFYFCKR
jgi:hypothetical protein